jgi:hypothetical protein
MPRVKLSPRNVLSLPAESGERTDYTDAVVQGLTLRVGASGTRTYFVRYARGTKRYKLADARKLLTEAGKPDVVAARKQAREVLARVARGEDPAGERAEERRAEVEERDTFEALARRLVGAAQLADTTRRSWLWLLERRVFPKLGRRDPVAITRGDVRELLAGFEGAVANDVLKVVRWTHARAVEVELLEHSPCEGLRRNSRATVC